jgi:hypothetical protein
MGPEAGFPSGRLLVPNGTWVPHHGQMWPIIIRIHTENGNNAYYEIRNRERESWPCIQKTLIAILPALHHGFGINIA